MNHRSLDRREPLRRIRAFHLSFLLLFLLPLSIHAQDQPYLIPQTVFVGDPGQLIVPLGPEFAALLPVQDNPLYGEVLKGGPPNNSSDIFISRITLESRTRLVIEFIAYRPGSIALPPITVGGYTFPDLKVSIASILDRDTSSLALSGPAAPLAVPGTMILIYGTLLGLILGMAGILVFGIRGVPALKGWLARYRRRRAIRVLLKTLRRMGNRLGGQPGSEPEILMDLSREFRVLLGFLSGIDCRSMVPGEFLAYPSPSPEPSGPFLCAFFRRCDTLRFSGTPVSPGDVVTLLEEVRGFALGEERRERA